jgi:peptide chain release factor 2
MAMDFAAEIAALQQTFSSIREVSDVDLLRSEVAELTEQAAAPDLWDHPDEAQAVTSKLSHRQSTLERLEKFDSRIEDVELLVEMGEEENDPDALAEAEAEIDKLREDLGQLEISTLLNGDYD